MLARIVELPTEMDPVAWHVHEILFGFVAAAMAGFLLTAVPGWTGRPPLRGLPLAALAALWLAGRVAVALSAWIGAAAAAVVDIAFLAGLAAFCAREIAIGRNWRNLVVIALLAILIAANALFHIGETETAERAAVATVVTLIALIGGRVVPEFTRNWLRRGTARLPPQHDRFDSAAIAVTVAAAFAWVAVGDHPLVSALLALAAVALAARLAQWRGLSTLSEPLLWVLHLGYLWLPVGRKRPA
ncbi:MAG: NnrS family protein [Rhodospirillaceae bacterium]|nr:NnrS family protein [Rhodospirillaceae bacterium]MYI50488.1 NnrS family protein [Rhodospirillaceae bacterium]